MDLHLEAKLVKHRCHNDAVDEATHREIEVLDGGTDEEKNKYPEAAHNPQSGGR